MIFVDTGAFVARWVERDQHHAEARAGWEELKRRRLQCATSSSVLDETLTLLGRRISHAFAAERGRNLWASSVLHIWRAERQDELAALELFAKYADQRVSFTDCISFALMRRHRARQAFTFDRHFELAGFQRWPG